ncbi:MAG: hypothetical protein JXJ22_04675 [Bacteroidales bacterium]|nr:hypothetical protein [Bacteroidales bacterium]
MKRKIKRIYLLAAFISLVVMGCTKEGPVGPAGQDGQDGLDATVYYSEWFSPTEWSGEPGDWYFEAIAPDLTEDVVEGGVILAYVWLVGDLYESNSVRPLPAYAVGANWSFLIYQYGSIEFTCDMIGIPATTGNYFRFIAIPGTILALKSTSSANISEQELKNMQYQEVCKLFNIPE